MVVPLISRKILFGNPDRTSVQLSPDGSQIAYLAPRNGVLNVWVAPRTRPAAARPVTQDTGRGIRFYGWAYTSSHILYIQDKNGDENWRLYSVDLTEDHVKDLTPFENVQAQVKKTSRLFPHEIIIGLNRRDPQWHDLYHLDLLNGALNLIEENNRFLDYLVAEDFSLLLAMNMTPDGGMQLHRPGQAGWELWDEIPPADTLTTTPIGSDQTNRQVFLKDSRGRDTAALVSCDLASKLITQLAEDPQADAADVIQHPVTQQIQAVAFVYTRKRWQILDPAIEPDLAYLHSLAGEALAEEVEILSRTLDDRYWIVQHLVDDGPVRFYLYDRQQRQAEFLFTNRQDLENQPLAKMHSVVIQARDGLNLVAYYTLPLDTDRDGDGFPDHPLPMVFMPHGGPWGRDVWGYNAYHQWLANRGYAVLCVNFRSSTGFGKAFTNAGDLEWGGKIHADQIDAVQWAIQSGIADPQRVAVMGGSFGGYSTLAGLTFTPDVFACGVDLVGPSNLVTLLESVPPYWKPMLDLLTTRVGDHRTESGRALLEKHSPLTYVDRIARPLLIGQGANDPRVKQAESDQIVQAMQAKGIPVTYLLYPDEGHGFARPENNLSFNAIAEAFLAKYLGGRFEPIGTDFENSSHQVLTGAAEVPGLPGALDSD
jgi:dipeptidyl aminopeptidase/acylaminoacyl peptidase